MSEGKIQEKCMYLSWVVLNNKSVEICRHPDNLSCGKPWGQCQEDKCPFEEATQNE